LSLSPHAVTSELRISVLSNVYDTLIDPDPDLDLLPGLAESWFSPGDHTWVFRLREGVRLHDGRELTARDVVDALEHARLLSRGSLINLDDVKSIEATGNRELRIRTVQPLPSLAQRLCFLFIAVAPQAPDAAEVGTGPYTISRFEPGALVELSAFSDSWRGRPPFEKVQFRQYSTDQALAEAIRDGSVDLAEVTSGPIRLEASERRDMTVFNRRGLVVEFLSFETGTSSGANPLDDARVRRAVEFAIDRTRLAAVLGPDVVPLHQLTVPEVHGYHTGLLPAACDPDRSRELLESSGWGSGFDVGLRIRARPSEPLGAPLAEALEAVGIRAHRVDPGSTDERPRLTLYRVSFPADASWTYEMLLGSSLTSPGPWQQRLAPLIREAKTEMDPMKRLAALESVAEAIREEAIVIPLFQHPDEYGVADGLTFRPRLDRTLRIIDLDWRSTR
jgi:peptide/nickel transport system substrate-binding protein